MLAVVLLIASSLLCFSSVAHADTQLSACGPISTSGAYQLTQDLVVSSNSTCFTFQASDITLDGAGHTITQLVYYASNTDPAIVVAAGADGAVINNVELVGWQFGVLIEGNAAVVSDVSVHGSPQAGAAIYVTGSNRTSVLNCEVYDQNSTNTNFGIYFSNSHSGQVGHNSVGGLLGGQAIGLYISKSSGNTIYNNTLAKIGDSAGGGCPGGNSSYGVVITGNNNIVSGTALADVIGQDGPDDVDCGNEFTADGGLAYGFYITGSNNQIINTAISNVAAGRAGNGHSINATGGFGGNAFGIAVLTGAGNLVWNAAISGVAGGAGGNCGPSGTSCYSGGAGNTYGIYFGAPNTTVTNAVINNVTGASGGGDGSYGYGGTGGTSVGLDADANSEGSSISGVVMYGVRAGPIGLGYQPGNFGLAVGVWIQSDGVTLIDTNIQQVLGQAPDTSSLAIIDVLDTNVTCPSDTLLYSSSVCWPPMNVSCCTQSCQPIPAGGECRPVAGVCDVAELCTGHSVTCPPDEFHGNETMCQTAQSFCATDSYCNATGPDCPANGFASPKLVCRNSTGVCDQFENCTGQDYACPPDRFAPFTQLCRAALGVCDQPEYCLGTSVNCPPDFLAPNGTDCGTGTCQHCSGSSIDCPLANICPSSTGGNEESSNHPVHTASSGGLTKDDKIAIGVVVPVVALIVIAIVIVVLVKHRRDERMYGDGGLNQLY